MAKKNILTLAKALEEGNNHITCNNGLELDVKDIGDGNVLLHHIEMNGQKANNRIKIKIKDAEAFLEKSGNGISGASPAKYDDVKPEVSTEESPIDNYKEPEAEEAPKKKTDYQYDEDGSDDEDWGDIGNETESENDDEEETTGQGSDEEEVSAEDSNDGFTFDDTDDWDSESSDSPDDTNDLFDDEFETDKKSVKQVENEPETLNIGEDNFTQGENTADTVNNEAPEFVYQNYQSLNDMSIVTYDMSLVGDINTKSSINIMGCVSGNVSTEKRVIVSGFIDGDITAGEEIILGDISDGAEIKGKLTSNGDINVDAKSVIIGDVKADNNVVIKGSVLGDIDASEKIWVCSGAKVKGNITSKVIKIDQGAMIDGVCTQKYAENNANDFFDNYTMKMTNEPLNKDRPDRKRAKAGEVPMAELVKEA